MSEERGSLDNLISALTQERDALKVKVNLAQKEAKQEFDRLSGKIDELTCQYDPVKKAVSESAEGVVAALMLAAGELKNGVKRVKDSLREE